MNKFVYTAPDSTTDHRYPSVFVGGGITGCEQWQKPFVDELRGDVVVYNPRRDVWDVNDHTIEKQQIDWEIERLRIVDILVFWFPPATLCPITLYELGRYGTSSKRSLFVGVDRGYARKTDVYIQMYADRPEIEIVGSLAKLAEQVNREIALRNLQQSYA